jgi:type II secretory pathway component PulK
VKRSPGYALILAAVVVALLALVLLAVARVQGDISPGLRAAREEARREAAVHSAVARVGFLLLSEPIGPRSILVGGPRAAGAATAASGAREVRLDGRFYALRAVGERRVLASVQDENGLLNLNAGDDAALSRLLAQAGVAGADRLAATLGDYADGDDLARANGAEADVYRRARLLPPPNLALNTRWSALGALGWPALAARGDVWGDLSAAPHGTGLNLNTASLNVLEAVLGDARGARAVLAKREQGELRGRQDIEALTGINTRADGMALASQTGTAFRVVIAFGDGRRVYESQLALAEPGAARPIFWRDLRLAAARHGRESEALASLPEQALSQ